MAGRSLPVVRQEERPLAWEDSQGAGAPDDSLTSLQWLQEFSFFPADLASLAPLPASGQHGPSRALQGSYGPASPPAGDTAAKGMPASMAKPACASSTNFRQPSGPTLKAINYKADAQAKPPYSYATLICMAMHASPEAKLTLSAIYSWITENFSYYRHAEPSWQNSIRHNLSLNKCFQKVPRGKDEPGKGGFWRIDPQYADLLASGVFPRKRMLALPPPATHARHGSGRRESGGSLLSMTCKQPGRATGRAPSSPMAEPHGETSGLPGSLRWASGPETFDAAPGEDLELTTALGALAPAEDLPPLSGHLPQGVVSQRAPSRPATPPADEDLVLRLEPLTEPWEEAGAEPVLGASWGLEEEEPCFAESLLVEMQPWEV